MKSCQIKRETRCGIETIIIENALIRAVILAGKGADLLEFIWKPLNINCLYRSDVPMEVYKNLDLKNKRLKNHSDYTLGGWSDVLPHRGEYENIVLEQDNGGIAATIPYKCEILSDTKDFVSIKLSAELPVFPMLVEKIFQISESEPTKLFISENVKNIGNDKMNFTWTQHALFGGDFIDADNENTEIITTSNRVFKAWEHMENPNNPLEKFEDEIHNVNLRQGTFDLRKPLPRGCSEYEFVVYNHLQKGEAILLNKKNNLQVKMNWDLNEFPYLRALYQNTGRENVVGLEPSNDLFSGWEHSKNHKTFTTLNKNESICTNFQLEYLEWESEN